MLSTTVKYLATFSLCSSIASANDENGAYMVRISLFTLDSTCFQNVPEANVYSHQNYQHYTFPFKSLIGNAHMQSSPEYELLMEHFQEAMSKSKEAIGKSDHTSLSINKEEESKQQQSLRNLKRSKSWSYKQDKRNECNPDEDVVLADFEQWKDETGYWIGEYSFYGPDGKPNVSTSWPYPYQSYKGFITGNVEG